MKKEFKNILLVFALIVSLTVICLAVSGCMNGEGASSQFFTLSTTKNTATETTASTQASTSATTTPVVPTGKYTNPLTGLTVSKDFSNQRPVAIVVDNIDNAVKNQTGLGQADILYEGLVAPGITRFLAVIEDYENISAICNIRSGRDYHIYSAFNHNAILVCHGGSVTKTPSSTLFFNVVENLLGYTVDAKNNIYYGFVNTIQEKQFSQIESGLRLGTIHFYTGKDYSKIYSKADTLKKITAVATYPGRTDLNYDTLVTASALKEVLSLGYCTTVPGFTTEGAPTQSLKFASGSADMSKGVSATTAVVKFTTEYASGAKYVEYTYRDGKYYRAQNGSAHVDSATGVQLSFTNLITLNVASACYTGTAEDSKLVNLTVTGTGTGMYITGGKAISITWTKSTETSPLVLRDASGAELALTPGNTCISYVNAADSTSVSVS